MYRVEIRTERGILQLWQDVNRWRWASPNGSSGSDEESFDDAIASAFAAEGLDSADYGYMSAAKPLD